MTHPFFHELREEGARMPNGKEFPPLFNFTREGKTPFLSVKRHILTELHCYRAFSATGFDSAARTSAL